MERTTSYYSDGYKIGCTLFEPEEAKEKSCPGIVLCQGMNGTKELFWLPTISRLLAELGFVSLIWDFRGKGGSEGEVGKLYPLEQAMDIRNGLTFLELQPKVDPERLALFGWCFGGGMVPYVAGVDKRVRCAVSAVGFSDGEAWLRSLRRLWEWIDFNERVAEDRKSRVMHGKTELLGHREILVGDAVSKNDREAYYTKIPNMSGYKGAGWSLDTAEKIMEFKPIEVVDRISDCPMLYIAAGKDTICPVEQTIDMYNRTNGQKKLWVIPGGAHYCVYGEPYLSQIVNMSIDWMREHLHMEYSNGGPVSVEEAALAQAARVG